MPAPLSVHELTVASREDPRFVGFPDRENIEEVRARGYDTFIRLTKVIRHYALPKVADITEHLSQTDTEIKRLSIASVSVKELVQPVKVPAHRWVLIPMRESTERWYGDTTDLVPQGFALGAEVEILKGEPVCTPTDYSALEPTTDQAILLARGIINTYTEVSDTTNEVQPKLGDMYPYQFMKSTNDLGDLHLAYVDIEPRLTTW